MYTFLYGRKIVTSRVSGWLWRVMFTGVVFCISLWCRHYDSKFARQELKQTLSFIHIFIASVAVIIIMMRLYLHRMMRLYLHRRPFSCKVSSDSCNFCFMPMICNLQSYGYHMVQLQIPVI